MKRLFTKPCPFCGTAIMGKKRTDRNAYHYAPRCPDCARKTFDPVILETKQKTLQSNRVTYPVGSKRLHKARDGLYYVRIKINEPNKWEYEHRFVMGAIKGQHVHHKNHDTQDNRIENLVLMTPSEHRATHQITQWSVKYQCCQGCSTTLKKHLSFGLCTTCYQRQHIAKK
jgi:hypothetical protein